MTVNSKVLAETLFTEFIQSKPSPVPEDMHVEDAAVPVLEAKILLYEYVTILLAILGEAEKRPQFNSVREHFERLYFPAGIDFGALQNVRAAMADLSTLLTPREGEVHKPLSWARDWLGRIGIEETNPVTLDLIALGWMGYYIAAVDLLKEFDPVA
jgi:hypothetical protein